LINQLEGALFSASRQEKAGVTSRDDDYDFHQLRRRRRYVDDDTSTTTIVDDDDFQFSKAGVPGRHDNTMTFVNERHRFTLA
jgi:hypothetical protein